ncbi:MAG: DUF2283 domain-containing protein [Dehalococcoidia bacterium]|nr:DUF2283 domain-containing protein [Dehalococcoidia bacterium]
MNISFDEQVDALYIQFRQGSVNKTIKLQDGILMDIDHSGAIFGIEILDASMRLPLDSLGKINIDLPIKSASR